jgi:hypothetical protein
VNAPGGRDRLGRLQSASRRLALVKNRFTLFRIRRRIDIFGENLEQTRDAPLAVLPKAADEDVRDPNPTERVRLRVFFRKRTTWLKAFEIKDR